MRELNLNEVYAISGGSQVDDPVEIMIGCCLLMTYTALIVGSVVVVGAILTYQQLSD